MEPVPVERRDRSLLGRLAKRIGRRGAFLLLLGFIFILRGETLINVHFDQDEAEAWSIALRLAPQWAWGITFVIAGVVASFMAFVHTKDRRRSDAVGFGFLQAVAVAKVSALMSAAIFGLGGGVALRISVSWLIVVVAIAVVAGWEEAPK